MFNYGSVGKSSSINYRFKIIATEIAHLGLLLMESYRVTDPDLLGSDPDPL